MCGIVGKYRKVRLPGRANDPVALSVSTYREALFRTFSNLGFPVWRAFGANVGQGPVQR